MSFRHREDAHQGEAVVIGPELIVVEFGGERPPSGETCGDRRLESRADGGELRTAWPASELHGHRRGPAGVPEEPQPDAIVAWRPRLRAWVEYGDAEVRRRYGGRNADDDGQLHRCPRESALLQVGQHHDLGAAVLVREDVPRLREGDAKVEAYFGSRRGAHRGPEHGRWRAPGEPVGRQEPKGVFRGGLVEHRCGSLPEAVEHRRPIGDGAAARRIVEDQDERRGRVAGESVAGHGRAGGRQQQRQHQEGPDEQEEPMLELQSAAMVACDLLEIPDRGERDGRRLAARDQMQEQWERRQRKGPEPDGVEESRHVTPPGRTSASRSALPKGRSVRMAW